MLVRVTDKSLIVMNHKVINLLWIAVEKFGMTLISIATFFIYAKILSPYEFGLGVLALSVGQGVAIMFGSLFEDPLVQKKNASSMHFNTALWGGLIISSVLIVFLSVLISNLDLEKRLFWLMWISLLHILLFSLSSIYVAQCRRANEFSVLAKRAVVSRLTGAVVGIVLVLNNFGAIAIVLQSLVFEVIGFLYLFFRSKFKVGKMFDIGLLKQLLSIGWVLCLRRLSWDSATRGLPIVLGIVANPVIVGLYGFAWRIVEMPRSAVFGGLMSYALPTFSRHQNNQINIEELFLNSTQFTYLLLAPFFTGLAVIAPTLIHAFFGAEWHDAILPTQILCIAALISLSRIYAVVCSTAIAKPKTALLSDLIGTITALTIGFFLGGEFGALAAAGAMLVRSLITFPFSIIGMKKITGIEYINQIKILLPGIVSCLFMFFIVYYARSFLIATPIIIQLFFECVIGAASYFFAVFLIYPKWINDLKKMLGK